jgi:hypothetical protein
MILLCDSAVMLEGKELRGAREVWNSLARPGPGLMVKWIPKRLTRIALDLGVQFPAGLGAFYAGFNL